MGKAGRIACIFVPMALTVAAGVLLALVGIGQTNSSSQFFSDVYFLRANLSEAYNISGINTIHKTNATVSSDVDKDGNIILYNAYSIGLWNYCAGGGALKNDTGPQANGTDPATSVAFCTSPAVQFAFNPEQVWGFEANEALSLFNGTLESTLEKYENGLGSALGPLFIITIAGVGASILVGLGAIFSRCGSLATTLVVMLTTVVDFVFAVIATFAYFSLEGAFNEAYKNVNISVHHGVNAFVFVWLSVACLLVGGLFWAFSSCCVSGRSSRRATKEIQYVGSGSHSYQPMEANAGFNGPAPTAYNQRSAGYEPFRQT